jgi:DNA-binding MarR family transcriptional regulator
MSALDELFREVTALAHQLRRIDFHSQQNGGLLAAGRAVLQLLDQEGPLTVPAIATRQNSSRQNVQIIANRFQREGLIEFLANPAHKKSDLLQITDRGRTVLSETAERETSVRDLLTSIPAGPEVAVAIDLMRQIREKLANEIDGKQKSRPENSIDSENGLQYSPAAEDGDDGSLPVNLL